MKSNWTVTCNTPITEYIIDSKGIREKPRKGRKKSADASEPPKRHENRDKSD